MVSQSSSIVRCGIDLPANFRRGDFLAFHGRDSQMLAEKTSPAGLEKGLFWNGQPACLKISFEELRAQLSLSVDSIHPDCAVQDSTALADQLYRTGKHMLGLDQKVEDFEARYREHPQIGGLVSGQSGLRVPQTATPFEALSWAIIGQQVSVSAAVSIRRKFIQAVGKPHSSGLWCFPDAASVAGVEADDLRNAGFSQGKAQALLALSRSLAAGTFFPAAFSQAGWLATLQDDKTEAAMELQRQLLGVRGIGPWTVSYVLLRGFGWLDGSLHGDVAVRRNMGRLLGFTEKVTEKQAEQWLTDFSPWRALLGAHLWAMQAADGY